MSGDMSTPNYLSPRDDYRQILHDQAIDENGPGTILRDFEVLLGFISQDGIPLSGAYELLPMTLLRHLNAQLTHPIEIGLKRPKQNSYPHISGLYLLLRATGLASVLVKPTSKLLVLDDPAFESWRRLDPTERYFTLLESWLLWSRPEVLGESGGWLSFPIMRWALYFGISWYAVSGKAPPMGAIALVEMGQSRKVRRDFFQWIPVQVRDQELSIIYFPGIYFVALLELFGLISVQHDKSEAGKGWRIAEVRRTTFGEALLQLLLPLHYGKYLSKYLGDGMDVVFGELQGVVQAFFPEWRQNLSSPSKPNLRHRTL